VVESVYSAVRTDSFYKADYASSLKGLSLLVSDGASASFARNVSGLGDV